MAEQYSKNIMHYCHEEHIGCEMESTEHYAWMCRMHVPIYLFINSNDEGFLKYHYGVSEFSLLDSDNDR